MGMFTKAHQIVTLVTKKEARGATKATENADTAPNVGHHYAIPLYGRLEPFQGDGSAWPIYEEQVGVFFRANDIPVEKQRDIFLASCGTRVLGLLLDLLNPATPHDKSLGELFATLRSHFSPAPSTLMERFRFNNRSHRGRETLGQFVAALRGLASGCAFGEQLDSLLRDCFACGINDPAMQTRLLELPDSSLDDAVKAALAMEAAAGSPSTESAVNKMATRCDKCSRCGGDHPPSKCQFAEAECFACGRTGHIARACRGGTADGRKQPSSSTCSAPVHGQIFDVRHTDMRQSSVPPYMLTGEVCWRPISMELDTGASVSVMAGKAFKRTFPDVPVEASGVMLRSYSGQLTQVDGQAQVSVRLGDREATLPLHLTKVPSLTAAGPELESRHWPGVGTFTGTAASIHVPDKAKPRFFKPCPLPLALKDGVTQELQQLQRDDFLVPVKSSEWAAPIVPVLKQDGSVRICGDFKITKKPVAAVEKYLLPRIEDLWSALSGGKKFTKLNLRDAYQQLVLQESSRKYVTISTTLGLFQYTRLPVGVASAPAIF
nr:uncharacterized protein K02A2.6-like [Rhipicephalus microplus]